MKDLSNIRMKLKWVILIVVASMITTYSAPPLINFLKKNDDSKWIITYYRDKHVVKITDFYNPRISITVSETEGLVFIRNIMVQDSSKIKDFNVE